MTKTDGLAERIEKYFTVRTVAQMGADFLADVVRELVIQVGRQPLQNFEAVTLSVTGVDWFARAGLGANA